AIDIDVPFVDPHNGRDRRQKPLGAKAEKPASANLQELDDVCVLIAFQALDRANAFAVCPDHHLPAQRFDSGINWQVLELIQMGRIYLDLTLRNLVSHTSFLSGSLLMVTLLLGLW